LPGGLSRTILGGLIHTASSALEILGSGDGRGHSGATAMDLDTALIAATLGGRGRGLGDGICGGGLGRSGL